MRMNDRVKTPHGPGTVIGFECFTEEGKYAGTTRVPSNPSSRVVVELDQPENWAGHAHGYPHYWRSELKKVASQRQQQTEGIEK